MRLLRVANRPFCSSRCLLSQRRRRMDSSSEASSYQEPSVEELIAREKSLSLEERRARYRCGDAFVTPDKFVAWGDSREKFANFFELAKPVEGIEANEAINQKVCLIQGDITRLEIDAVVNAANERLLGGGGIDGAIHSAAGRDLYYECKSLGGTPTGTTKLTRGYNLPARYILHTVGPIGHGEELLRSCYRTILQLVAEHDDIRTVAMCGVSTGIFGFDLKLATEIALGETRKWLEQPGNVDKVDRIIFCTFLEREVRMYATLMPGYFPIPGVELGGAKKMDEGEDKEEDREDEK